MINLLEINKLKEHHKNGYYFTDIEGEKYEEVKRSIEAQGIRDPIKCTRDYTVISGHQRLRIARDLGLEKVPYQMLDVDEKTAEYLLIAENVERRGQAETDPIKKSRIANFLREYWGVRHGMNRHTMSGQNVQSKTTADIAETIGESEKTTRRILKLHDLIPQLQRLVSDGKLGTTAGEQLAYLTPEVQTALYETLGDEIAKKTVKETQELRKDIDGKEVEEIRAELERLKERENIAKQEAQAARDNLEKARIEAEAMAKEPYGVKLGLAMYEAIEKLSDWQKEYSWIITDKTEFRKLIEADPNIARMFNRVDKFWQQMSEAFRGVRSKGTYREEADSAEIIDVEFTEVI